MSFSCEAGIGANEDHSFFDNKTPGIKNTDSSSSIDVDIDKDDMQDTERPLFNQIEPAKDLKFLQRRISMRKDSINGIGGIGIKILEEYERQLEKKITQKERVNYQSRRSKNFED
jgi:hypothetical protein